MRSRDLAWAAACVACLFLGQMLGRAPPRRESFAVAPPRPPRPRAPSPPPSAPPAAVVARPLNATRAAFTIVERLATPRARGVLGAQLLNVAANIPADWRLQVARATHLSDIPRARARRRALSLIHI